MWLTQILYKFINVCSVHLIKINPQLGPTRKEKQSRTKSLKITGQYEEIGRKTERKNEERNENEGYDIRF